MLFDASALRLTFGLGQIASDPGAEMRGSLLYQLLLTSGAVVVVAFVIAIIIVLATHQRWRKLMRKRSVILAIILSFVGIMIFFRPQKVSIDLSHSHQLSDVRWPKKRTDDFYSFSGKIDLTLKLPQGRAYEDHVESISINREGELISELEARGRPMTLETACNRVRTLCRAWGVSDSEIDTWRAQVHLGSLSPFAVFLQRSADLDIFVEARPSFNDGQPWCVVFAVRWGRQRGRES